MAWLKEPCPAVNNCKREDIKTSLSEAGHSQRCFARLIALLTLLPHCLSFYIFFQGERGNVKNLLTLVLHSFSLWFYKRSWHPATPPLPTPTPMHSHTHTQTQDGCFETFVVVHSLSPTLCDPMNCCTPDLPVLHYLPEFTQTHVHWCHPTISSPVNPPPLALNLSQHQGLFQWAGSSHQVARELELQLWQRSFQWIFKVDFL